MIRQICPSCFKSVELPDSAAGTTAPCPTCGKPFAVPAGYTPTVAAAERRDEPAPPPPPVAPTGTDRPPPPPGLVLPEDRPLPRNGLVMIGGSGTPPPTPEGYSGSRSIELSPLVVHWGPVAALTLAFVLTFFSWVGTFPGGMRVYTQSPWEALIGTGHNHSLGLTEWRELQPKISSNVVLLLPYLLCTIAAVALAWMERVGHYPDPAKLPPAIGRWVPLVTRNVVPLTTGLATAALVLVWFQLAQGFGLQTVIQERIDAEVAKLHDGPPPNPNVTPAQIGAVIGSYSLGSTTARDAAVLAHAAAVLALAARMWLERRGPAKPLPRAVVYW